MVRYLPLLLLLALWIHAFVDCLNTPDEQVRNLPKPVWILVILLFGEVLVGPVAWYAAGRPRPGSTGYAELPQSASPPLDLPRLSKPFLQADLARVIAQHVKPGVLPA